MFNAFQSKKRKAMERGESKRHERGESRAVEAKEKKHRKNGVAPVARAEAPKAKKHKKNWIAGAIKHPGALRSSLGVKSGAKIPPKKLAAAAKKPGVTGKRARLAQTLKSFHKKHKTVKEYEGSKLDNKLDRITGFKEGSKKDEAMDKAIAPHVKDKKHMKTHKKSVKCKTCGK